MRYVRWKPYGFTHIIREGATHKWNKGPVTLCGNSAHHYNNFRLGWWGITDTKRKAGLTEKDLDPMLLPPSDKDDGKRPLCGTCKRIADEKNA